MRLLVVNGKAAAKLNCAAATACRSSLVVLLLLLLAAVCDDEEEDEVEEEEEEEEAEGGGEEEEVGTCCCSFRTYSLTRSPNCASNRSSSSSTFGSAKKTPAAHAESIATGPPPSCPSELSLLVMIPPPLPSAADSDPGGVSRSITDIAQPRTAYR